MSKSQAPIRKIVTLAQNAGFKGLSSFQQRLKKLGPVGPKGLTILPSRLRRFSLQVRRQVNAVRRKLWYTLADSVLRVIISLRLVWRRITGSTNAPLQLQRRAPKAPPPKQIEISEPFLNRTTSLPEGECVYAIGDVHGRCDLLEKLIDLIEQDCRSLPSDTTVTLVFLGDYIDRGMQSSGVIDLLLSERISSFNTVFLKGNHEEALLRFWGEMSFGSQWARYGGAETLYSYGIHPPKAHGGFGTDDPDYWPRAWTSFREALPDPHLKFYQSLKHYYRLGDYFFVHAGLRPDTPLEEQTSRDMLWIREAFLESQTPFPFLVVHGHTPSNTVERDYRRIGLDTGAYYSGRLSAARFFGSDIDVLST